MRCQWQSLSEMLQMCRKMPQSSPLILNQIDNVARFHTNNSACMSHRTIRLLNVVTLLGLK
jgi:hypothetical protein